MNEIKTVEHTLEPIYDENSNILILGTMPSPKSREFMCYYGHPQNRFWRVMAAIFDCETPHGREECERFAHEHNLALWDTLKSCEIKGASDTSIKNSVPNDIPWILERTDIKLICTTGQKAAQLYKRFILPTTGIEALALPSTSAANCRNYNLEALIKEYKVILEYIE